MRLILDKSRKIFNANFLYKLLISLTISGGFSIIHPTSVFASHQPCHPVGRLSSTDVINIGIRCIYRDDFETAEELFQLVLDSPQVSDSSVERAWALFGTGLLKLESNQVNSDRGFDEVSRIFQDAISIFELDLSSRNAQRGLAFTYGHMGSLNQLRDRYPDSIPFYEKALDLWQELVVPERVAYSFHSLAWAHNRIGKYPEALTAIRESQSIFSSIGDRSGFASALDIEASIHDNLGEYTVALSKYQESLAITRAICRQQPDECNYGLQAVTLSNMGFVLNNLSRSGEARSNLEEALQICDRHNACDSDFRAKILSNLGAAELALGSSQQSIETIERSIALKEASGDRLGLARSYRQLGFIYQRRGDYDTAFDFFQNSLAVIQQLEGQQAETARTLTHLGDLLIEMRQPEASIVFLKSAVNEYEKARENLVALDPELQRSHTESISRTYRVLADLLLEQGRVLEAQQVLELLKVQELEEYTDDERTGESLKRTIPPPEGCDLDVPFLKVSLLKVECDLIGSYNSLIEFGRQFKECEMSRCSSLDDYRKQRNDLFKGYRTAVTDLEDFIRDRIASDEALLRPTEFHTRAEDIIGQQPGTVIVYPLVLDDKLWLLFAADGRVNSKREVDVTQLELGQTVVKFRELLENRYSNLDELQATGKKLYDWLITPIETELASNQDIKHLVFSLDRTTRYIPMATLFDGSQYLIEKYTVTTILSAALTRVDERAPIGTDNVSILGAGVSEEAILGAGVSEEKINFPALPNVPIELDAIIQDTDRDDDTEGLYIGRQFLDDRFTFESLESALFDTSPQFLHIATHGEFIPGNRDASYLLMGNGQKLPIPDIDTLGTYLEGVHLAVLSACQTALGGPNEEGIEIAGLGYYFLKNKVDAVMASLWNVNDSSTSQLMQAFYQTLSESTIAEPVTKAEALRTAQLSLLRSNDSNNTDIGRFTRIPQTPDDKPRPASGLAHPYYWAPFILIGNGL